MDILVRDATREDARAVTALMLAAAESIACTLAGSADRDVVTREIEAYFRMEGSRLSFRSTSVALSGGEIAGMVVSYPGCESRALDEPILRRLRSRGCAPAPFDRECFDDEYYVDSLAVFPHLRRAGIGRLLLDEAEKRGRALGMAKSALLADESAEENVKRYERWGYAADCTLQVSGHRYLHMIKRL